MGRLERMRLICNIESKLNSRLLVFITGDRTGLETIIASDSVPHIFRHLTSIGDQEKVHLFLYSAGGLTIAGFGIVNMIREFCKLFSVIVPYKALSTATLIALDNIIMSRMGQLSPIDPSVQHTLGPTVALPNQPCMI
jgi:ATP-dependent protease ClpP protease subunit